MRNMNKEILDKMPEWFHILRKAVREYREKESKAFSE